MVIGERIRNWREVKQLSQGDIEHRTGLLRCYISRVENGHTVPALDTMEKIARALEMPLYQLLYDGEKPPQPPEPSRQSSSQRLLWGHKRKEALLLTRFRRLLAKMGEEDRELFLYLAQCLANQSLRARISSEAGRSSARRAATAGASRGSSREATQTSAVSP